MGRSRRDRLTISAYYVPILIIVILALAFLLFKRSVREEESYLAGLKAQFDTIQKQTSKVIYLQNEIAALQEELDTLMGKKPTDPYLILSELESILQPEAVVQSFIMEKNFFQIEAVGVNPLGLMEIFKTKDIFENVKLVQIVPVKGSDQELFKITGTVHIE